MAYKINIFKTERIVQVIKYFFCIFYIIIKYQIALGALRLRQVGGAKVAHPRAGPTAAGPSRAITRTPRRPRGPRPRDRRLRRRDDPLGRLPEPPRQRASLRNPPRGRRATVGDGPRPDARGDARGHDGADGLSQRRQGRGPAERGADPPARRRAPPRPGRAPLPTRPAVVAAVHSRRTGQAIPADGVRVLCTSGILA